jgi:DNA-binding MarR family transcriptional regulator/ribosomal protein S18 acetylase RimI-like enzyme
MNDWIADSGYLFLGSRLKRLAEQMQSDVCQVSQRAGLAIQPGQFPLLALLHQGGSQTVGQLARVMGLSQPVITRNIGSLIALDLVRIDRSKTDGRSRIVSLTPQGEHAIVRSRETVWPHVEAAVREVVEGLSGPLLEQISQIERALDERSLAARAASIASEELVHARDTDIPDIVALMNRAYRGPPTATNWATEAGYITGNRTNEALLRSEIGSAPTASLMLWRDDREGSLKGCVWLEPLGDTVWYLGSLTIDPQRQNEGLGRTLLLSAERWMHRRGAGRVRLTVINVRETLIAWYLRRGYRRTGETTPFPYGDDRFGTPQRDDLNFVVLEKELQPSDASG